jgi:PAS domain S-box-containing protein
MAGDLQEIFLLALNHFYKKYKEKGGTQKKLAMKMGVTQSYISAVLNSTKKASTEVQERLANILYGPYDDFLAVGRRLQYGLDPELIRKNDRDEAVESLIERLSHYIRDYQRIEKDLIDTKNFYKVVIEKMESGVLVTDVNDNIFFINTWLLNRIGVPKKNLIGSNVIEANKDFPLVNIMELQNNYLMAKENLEQQRFNEIKLITPAGREVYRSGWCIPLLDNKMYKGMIVTIGDITEEVLLREKLRIESRLLKKAMNSFEKFGWMILDKSKQIIKRNETYVEMFNIPAEILEDDDFKKNMEWVKHYTCDQVSFIQLSVEFPRHEKEFIHEFDLVDGRQIRRVTSVIFDDGDEILGWNIMIYDITPDKEF